MAVADVTVHAGLVPRRLGVGSLIFLTVSASAPITVLAGGVVATYAVTGSTGVALSFPILAAVLALFSVGYAAMAGHISNAGAFSAFLAQGLGRAWGVAASSVAVVSYNAIQFALYGLFGAQLGIFAAGRFGVSLPWWVWAAGAGVVVGVLGLLRVDLSARVVGVLLVLELVAVVLFDLGAFAHPAGGSVGFAALDPANLFTGAAGGVFAFGVAAFVGVESAAVFSEEVTDPRGVARATYWAIAITGVMYTVSAWALATGAGTSTMDTPDGPRPAVTVAARDPDSNVVLALTADNLGRTVADVTSVLFITSVFAALLSFHQGVARYVFALGRERILPAVLGRTWQRTGAPVGGSVAHSLLAFAVVAAFALAGRDPMLELFTWLSYVAAVGVLLLMTGTCAAVVGFFRRRARERRLALERKRRERRRRRKGRPTPPPEPIPDLTETLWQRRTAPVLAGAALLAVTAVTVFNADSVLGAARGSALTYLLPAITIATAVAGYAWGRFLKARRPDIYRGIGSGGA